MKRFTLIAALMLFAASLSFGQVSVRNARVSTGGDLVTIELNPMRAAGCTTWIDVAANASSLHTLTFTYRTQPSAITVTFYTSQDAGASTNTVGTSTSTTGATIQGSAVASQFAVCITGLTGSVELRAVYRGSGASATIDTTGLSTSAKQDTGNTSLASVKTNTDTLVTSGGGGYVRQDTTGTIAKETGGNLASIKTNSDTLAGAVSSSGVKIRYTDGTAIAATDVALVAPWASGTLAAGAVTSAMTGTTSTSVIGATASNYIYLTQCTVSNASTTVSTDILLQDGSGGTTLYVLPAPAAAVATTGGGGGTFTFPTPLKVTTAGNALFAANVTTGSSTKISCSGYKSTVSY